MLGASLDNHPLLDKQHFQWRFVKQRNMALGILWEMN